MSEETLLNSAPRLINKLISLIKILWLYALILGIDGWVNSTSSTSSEFLRSLFLQRKGRNPAYSTRAFARDLGMSQALLSLIMNGKHALSLKQAFRIATILNLPEDQAAALLGLPRSKGGKGGRFSDLNVDRFKAISQWHHVAILDLATTAGFRPDPSWVARRLRISPVEARDAMERLIALGFLVRENGSLRKVDEKMFFATQRSEPAVREFHRQVIGKAIDELDDPSDEAFEARQISAMTLAMPRSVWPLAKMKIRQFQKDMASLLTEGKCEEVYQLNIQMFPLSRPVAQKHSRSRKEKS